MENVWFKETIKGSNKRKQGRVDDCYKDGAFRVSIKKVVTKKGGGGGKKKRMVLSSHCKREWLQT